MTLIISRTNSNIKLQMSGIDKVTELLASFSELQRVRTRLEGELKRSQTEREQWGKSPYIS